MEILFFLNPDDLKTLKELFEQKSDPGFTILSEEYIDGRELAWVNVYFSDSIRLWYTIGEVFQKQSHERRIKEIISQMPKSMQDGLL